LCSEYIQKGYCNPFSSRCQFSHRPDRVEEEKQRRQQSGEQCHGVDTWDNVSSSWGDQYNNNTQNVCSVVGSSAMVDQSWSQQSLQTVSHVSSNSGDKQVNKKRLRLDFEIIN
jgi:hypothetical protein